MTVTNRHGLYAVSLGATILGGITRQNLATGTEVKGEATSGDVWARFQAMYAQKVSPGFSTLNIAAALAACGASGGNIADMSGGLSLWAQKFLAGGTRTVGATHRKFNFTTGILAPRQLSVSHRGDATLTYDAVIVWDGSNDPVVITDTVSLPTAPTDLQRFTLGTLKLGSFTLSEKTSLTIDFGLDVVGESADSDIWDTMATIRGQQTVISVHTMDLTSFAAGVVPLAGLSGTHANSIFYLRKRAAGGSFVADGTAEHIKLDCAGTIYVEQAMDASGHEAAGLVIKMPLKYDGSNNPLVINTASAIT